jgi:hypothetical protein
LNIRTLLGASLAALLALPAVGLAEENTEDVALPEWVAETRLAFIAGIATGGDTIATAELSDGTTEKIKAGQGIHLALGVWREITPAVVVQGTWGYFVDDTSASDSNMRFSRYPLDLLVYYRPQHFYIGGGFTRHGSPTFDGDGFLPNIEFKDATGTVFDIGYRWFGLRFTQITYKGEVEGFGIPVEYDGDGVELMINAAFR